MSNITLAILAEELQLSIATVSKALRDSHEISTATKKRVLKKAKDVNYQVNHFASSLRKKKSKTIAVVMPEIANNFFSLVINGVESVAQQKGYHVLIYLSHENFNREKAITAELQNGRVDGIMASLSMETTSTEHLEELQKKNMPLVLFDRVAENMAVPKVTTNDFESAFIAVKHLLENGCRRIAFLSVSNCLSINKNRLKGYKAALKANAVPFNSELLVQCTNDDAKNTGQLKKLLSRKKRPDGIFASVEKLAVPCYEVCNELNIRIPEDIKIISYSNLQLAALLAPSMTTIAQPAFDMGRESASILFKLIEKKGVSPIPENTVLKSTLIPRNSTVAIHK
jgi:LacI family transcriptional regulator